MKNNRKKKAFTLTELLVVVIVIGVLSAVVLPKFSKVIETRKTTEAEEMMAAVRTEQERRCSLDKNYTTDAAAVNLASLNTKNFNYTLKNTGIEAASTGKYGYTLKMPSYRDGRLCCDSAEQCAKLNKNYPLCSELTAKADYTSGAECAAGEVPDNTPKTCEGSSTQACGCKNGGTQTRTCDTTTGTWSAWSACSISDSCACTGTQPDSSQSCNTCGTQTRTVTCDSTTGEWLPGEWGTCDKTAEECATDEDCCSDSVSDFAACIAKQYGTDSAEYICATGKHLGWQKDIGSLVGASACASKVMPFGCFLRAANNTCPEGDKACAEMRKINASWISSGFKRYACTRELPNTDVDVSDEKEDEYELVWEDVDWSNYITREKEVCNSLESRQSIIRELCASIRESDNLRDCGTREPKSEGEMCYKYCGLGGKKYPKGTILYYEEDESKRPVSSGYWDYMTKCVKYEFGSGGNCIAEESYGPLLCIIPYSFDVKMARKRKK